MRCGRSVALRALFLSVTLSASSVGAEPSPTGLERQGDISLARGHDFEALRLYERALEAGDLGRSDSTRLLAKRSKALRIFDQGILAQQRASYTKGDHARVLRLDNFEEADLRAEELLLVEASSRALVSAGDADPVFAFLREYSCRDSACNAMRVRLWRALASFPPSVTDVDLTPGQYWRVAEEYDSLATYVPDASVLKQSRDRVYALASAFHSRQAAELAQLAGAAYFHHRMAARYGAPATLESRNARRAIEVSTALTWRVAATKGQATCSDFVGRLMAALPRDHGQPVFVELRLDSCGPGRYSWKEEEPYSYSETVTRGTGVKQTSSQQVTQSDATGVTVPGSTHAGDEPAEVLHVGRREVVREGETYFVRGKAALSWGENHRDVELDLHPKFSGKPRPGEMLGIAARDARELLLAAGARMAAERSDEALLRAPRAEMIGDSDVAENEYVIAVRLSGTVPARAREFFERHYGLRSDDVKTCLFGD